MRGRKLPRSQNLRCAVSIPNYFPNEVLSFPLSLLCSFRGRNVLKEGGFVTPRPEKEYGTCNRRCAYVHPKDFLNYLSVIVVFLECCTRTRVRL